MKTKIIPAINAQTFEEIKEKINLLKDLTNYFHLDVSGLEFTGYQTWQNPNDLTKIENSNFDLHLMLSLKPQEILKWAKENVKSLILHLEVNNNADGLLKMAKKTKKKIFIAWSPDVEFDFIKKYLNYVDGVLILGVKPGRAGQKFLEATYSRIEQILADNTDKNYPHKYVLNPHRSVKIMIDGGVNDKNFQKILSYEPDFIVMASAIYDSENPKERYLWFSSQIKN
jgi:ribulose-phosphate 3-epimerase